MTWLSRSVGARALAISSSVSIKERREGIIRQTSRLATQEKFRAQVREELETVGFLENAKTKVPV
jgi:hypothetical protein